MTGGEVYVLDRERVLDERLGDGLMLAHELDADELASLCELVERHHRHTASMRAAEILEQWDEVASSFRRVTPSEGIRAERSDDAAREATEAI
jgi:glutamate synthase domain-containing protein 3